MHKRTRLLIGSVVAGSVLLLIINQTSRSVLRGSLLSDQNIAFALKDRADTNHDDLLTAREIRSSLSQIIRGVTAGNAQFDINQDGSVNRADITDAVRGFRALLAAVCANGVIDAGEMCDDGNSTNADGCSSVCAIETGSLCTGSPSVCSTPCGDGVCRSGDQENSISCPVDCTAQTYRSTPDPSTPWITEAGGRGNNPNCGKPGTINCVQYLKVKTFGYAVHLYTAMNPPAQAWGYYNGVKRFAYPSLSAEGGEILTKKYYQDDGSIVRLSHAGEQSASLSIVDRNIWGNLQYTDTVLDSLTVPFTITEPPSASRLQFSAELRAAGQEHEHIEVTGHIAEFQPSDEKLLRDDPMSAPRELLLVNSDGRFSFKIWKNAQEQRQSVSGQDDLVLWYDLSENPCPVTLMFGSAWEEPWIKPELMLSYKSVCVN